MTPKPLTVIHVTHEAVEHIGGIGAVLEGLLTSVVYKSAVGRSILIAPLWSNNEQATPAELLGSHDATVTYSSLDGTDTSGLAARLKPIEWAFGVRFILGKRTYAPDADATLSGEADVLLIDVRNPNHQRIHEFKKTLHDRFDIHASRYEHDADFEQWLRIAPPAIAALHALLSDQELPAVVVSHEYMGMCTALLATTDEHNRFRTVFHAHECSTARTIVEEHSGHDVAFYAAMRAGKAKGRYVEDVFGDQSSSYRHALISNAHRLDLSLAVGDETAEELRFLSKEMNNSRIELCYNGLPAAKLTSDDRNRSRELVFSWIERVTGSRPDYLFTHVTRPVISKGLWRDLGVCAHLQQPLREQGRTALYLLLTCGAPIRTREQANAMASSYNWPADHRLGPPDVQGPEVPLWRDIELFSNPARPGAGAITAMLVNQFGFSPDRLGDAAPEGLTTADLRRAADVEFGQSIYEPFGIAQLEPLHAGAICIPSAACGCCGFANRALEELNWSSDRARPLLVADYTSAPVEDPLSLTQEQRDDIEQGIMRDVAQRLAARLPSTEEDRLALLEDGQAIASRMSWDRVCEREFIPALQSIVMS